MTNSLASTAVSTLTPELSNTDGHITTTSKQVADHFGKDHAKVLRDIRNLIDQLPEAHKASFGFMQIEVEIGNGATRKDPAYRLTRDGFTLLAMGFTGKEALQWKLAYLTAFNKMEAELIAKLEAEPRIAYSVNPNDTLSAAQAEQLRLIFSKRCNDLSKEAQAAFMTKGWSKMKSHFGCTYRQIPQREFSEAVSLATRHAAEWVVLDAALPPPTAPAGIQRWLTTVNAQGALTVEPVPVDALVVTPDELPRLIMHDREGLFTAKQVQKIAMHANLAVMGEMVQRKKTTGLEIMTKQMRNLGGHDLCELMAQGYMEIGMRNTDTADAKDMVTGQRPSVH